VSRQQAGSGKEKERALSFSLQHPACCPPTFSIVLIDQKPGTG